jgi:hypothetical protein
MYAFDVLFEGLAGPVLAPCCLYTTSDVHVLVNGTERFAGDIRGYVGGHPEDPDPSGEMRTQSWQQILDLAAGDTVDFAVGDGFNRSYYADLTGISVIVSTSEGLPGDYNGNGTVDAADYVVWRDTAGTPEQYDAWRANFGRPTAAAATAVEATAAVPEPTASSSLVLLGAVLAACGIRLR